MNKTTLGLLIFVVLIVGSNAIMVLLVRGVSRLKWNLPKDWKTLRPYGKEDSGWNELNQRVQRLESHESDEDEA